MYPDFHVHETLERVLTKHALIAKQSAHQDETTDNVSIAFVDMYREFVKLWRYTKNEVDAFEQAMAEEYRQYLASMNDPKNYPKETNDD